MKHFWICLRGIDLISIERSTNMKPHEIQKGMSVYHICNGPGIIVNGILESYYYPEYRTLVAFVNGRTVLQHISNLEKYIPERK